MDSLQYETRLNHADYMNPYVFYNKFLFWLPRLESFISDTGRPPMKAQKFINFFRILYGCGLRVSEGLDLEPRDFDLDNRTVRIRKSKKTEYQATTILPYDIPMLEKMFGICSKSEKLFPASYNVMWLYGKDVGRLGGLSISQLQEKRVIEGIWTKIFRLSCSERMYALGANLSLIQRKLRNKILIPLGCQVEEDLYTLRSWENEQWTRR